MAHITTAGPRANNGMVVVTMAAAAASDTCDCKSGERLIVINADIADHTVTVAVPGTDRFGNANPDAVYTIVHGAGPHEIKLDKAFADPTDGYAHLAWSATTGMTRGVSR